MVEPAQPSQQLPVTIEDEMRRSYLDYAMSVIIGRAIPDVRDGLKPVHRRILYSMHEQRVLFNQSYKKSARIVGDVLGKYHPHGDSAVYDALVRMAQDFSMRHLLVDGQGNFGSVDGDPPAAMRYTEVRMARFASELLRDIDKDTVPFGPNFDESEQEPQVLPSRVPNLLVNGSGGIAVGMATNVPPHNLREVIDATIRLVAQPQLSVEELMLGDEDSGRLGVQGPDFPTAGFIYGRRGIVQAYKTGRGRVIMRARAEFESPPEGKGGREKIVVTELPYQVNKAELLKRIAELVREKRIDGIAELRDESDRQGMRMVIELKRDAHHEIVLNKLYQMTALQSTFGVHCLAIVGGRPQVLGLKDCLQAFVAHRREVITRRTRYELRQARLQLELLEGLGMAVTEVDLVVRTIREAPDPETARDRLRELPLQGLRAFLERAGRPPEELSAAQERGQYRLSERQAKAILDMRLARLTGLEREKLATEYGEVCDQIRALEVILASDARLIEVLIEELEEVRERYGEERRSEIVENTGEISMEDLIADEDVVVTVSKAGYVKRAALSEYRAQGRGGRGLRAMEVRDEDFISTLFVVNTHAHVLFLTDRGRAFLKKIYEIPAGSRASRGRAMVNFVGLDADERVAAIVPIRSFDEERYLLTCTTSGRVKRTLLSAYQNIRQNGIIGVAIEEGDALLTASVVGEDHHVLIGTRAGSSLRFVASEVRAVGRDSMGVKGIELREGDRVIAMDVLAPEDAERAQVLTISECGYGKRTPVQEWRQQSRAGLGVIAMETSERNGPLVSLRLVDEDEQIMVITNAAQVIRTRVSEVRSSGRNTQGVRIIRLGEDERVVDVAPLAEDDSAAEDEPSEDNNPEPQ